MVSYQGSHGGSGALGSGKRTRLDTVHATEAGGAGTLSVVRVTVGILGTAKGWEEAVEAREASTSASGRKTSQSWTRVWDKQTMVGSP